MFKYLSLRHYILVIILGFFLLPVFYGLTLYDAFLALLIDVIFCLFTLWSKNHKIYKHIKYLEMVADINAEAIVRKQHDYDIIENNNNTIDK
jgi:hypothetical protein